jgi:hypothetical protein
MCTTNSDLCKSYIPIRIEISFKLMYYDLIELRRILLIVVHRF